MLEILKRFEPGAGLTEKAALLKALTSPTTASTLRSFVSGLEMLARRRNWGVALPDPVLQVGALDSICRVILSKEPQANFKVQTWRHVTMQQETVNQFSHLLQSEMQTLALSTEKKESADAKVKQIQSSPEKGQVKPACRHWCANTECFRADKCKFAHSWTDVADKASRCWLCSSHEQRKADCPAAEKTEKTLKAPDKTSNDGKKDQRRARAKARTHPVLNS